MRTLHLCARIEYELLFNRSPQPVSRKWSETSSDVNCSDCIRDVCSIRITGWAHTTWALLWNFALSTMLSGRNLNWENGEILVFIRSTPWHPHYQRIIVLSSRYEEVIRFIRVDDWVSKNAKVNDFLMEMHVWTHWHTHSMNLTKRQHQTKA